MQWVCVDYQGYVDYVSRTAEVGLSTDDAALLFGNVEEIYQFNRFARLHLTITIISFPYEANMRNM